MKLTDTEALAAKEWMKQEGLSLRAAAALIGTYHPTFLGWINGGAINAFCRKRLWDFTCDYAAPDQRAEIESQLLPDAPRIAKALALAKRRNK